MFLLSRETPRLPLELTILSAGGVVVHETELSSLPSPAPAFTHVVVDRPRVQGERIKAAHYVQPQWVFDSFNLRVLAPVGEYGVGRVCPAHLSPFVEDEEGGYEPEQRRVQRGWVQGVRDVGEAMRVGREEEEGKGDGAGEAEEEEMDEEARFEVELEKERRALSRGEDDGTDDGEVDDDDDGDDDDDDEEEEEEDSSADEGSDEDAAEAEAKEAPTPTKTRRSAARSEDEEARELAKAMMGKKAARLYQRMQFGIAKKQAANEALKRKRDEAERKAEQPHQQQPQRQRAAGAGKKRSATAVMAPAQQQGASSGKKKRV